MKKESRQDRKNRLILLEPKYLLSSVSRHLNRKRMTNGVNDPVTLDEISDQFLVAYRFFEKMDLTTRTLVGDSEVVSADLELRVEDLTFEGLELFADGYQRWLQAYSRRTPEKRKEFLNKGDVSIMEKALQKMREEDAELLKE